ncbi:hypothetical protein Pmani_023158 [Petrolisthes manimaculis]|uniref:Uncharacterized protein n=1 Tax=Petrolisthes manimaculis TaxID=1843537 RepID=A0AAE1U3K6_9EUCA|nr:hypothetical protein Pmani_023158 [Petrolisthes manimaculis]
MKTPSIQEDSLRGQPYLTHSDTTRSRSVTCTVLLPIILSLWLSGVRTRGGEREEMQAGRQAEAEEWMREASGDED